MQKIILIICLSAILCTSCGKTDSVNEPQHMTTVEPEVVEKTQIDLYDGKIDIDNSYDGIAGGFYLFDSDKLPVMKEQVIESGYNMKFYLKAANPGTTEINYAISVIINNCYQDLVVNDENGNISNFAKGTLKPGQAQVQEIALDLERYEDSENKDNTINFIMTYYEPQMPEDELTLVPIAVTNEKHVIKFAEDEQENAEYAIVEPDIIDYPDSTINAPGNGYWILDDTNDTQLSYDFILDSSNTTKKFIINQSSSTRYAMIFEDDKPVKVNDGYLFSWNQKDGMPMELDIENIKGRYIYFIEFQDENDIVVSPLYYNK